MGYARDSTAIRVEGRRQVCRQIRCPARLDPMLQGVPRVAIHQGAQHLQHRVLNSKQNTHSIYI